MKKDHSKEKLATSKELKFRTFAALFKSIHLGTVSLTGIKKKNEKIIIIIIIIIIITRRRRRRRRRTEEEDPLTTYHLYLDQGLRL